MSSQQVKVVGVIGVPMQTPLTKKLKVEIGPLAEHHVFLFAIDSPVNLLGRDLLCQLGCTVRCTWGGVFLDLPQESSEQVLSLLKCTEGPVVFGGD